MVVMDFGVSRTQIKMCIKISFKRRGNVSDIYSIPYILFCTKLSHYFTIFNDGYGDGGELIMSGI